MVTNLSRHLSQASGWIRLFLEAIFHVNKVGYFASYFTLCTLRFQHNNQVVTAVQGSNCCSFCRRYGTRNTFCRQNSKA